MADVIHEGSTERAKPALARAFWEADPDQAFIALQVLAPVPTDKQEGTLDIVTREDLLRHESTKMAPGGVYGRGVLRTESTTYACEKYGHEQPLTDETRENYASVIDMELAKNRVCRTRIGLDLEIEVSAVVFDTAVWTGAPLYTDHASAPWDDATKPAIAHIEAACEKVRQATGVRPNALICSSQNVQRLLANDDIMARFPGNSGPISRAMRLNALGAIFGLEKLIEGSAVYNSAEEGADASMTDCWSDDYAMVARVANEGDPPNVPCIGRVVRWRSVSGEGVEVTSYREPQTDSDVIKARAYMDVLLIDAYFGHLMKVDA